MGLLARPSLQVWNKSYRVFWPRQWAFLEHGAGCPHWVICRPRRGPERRSLYPRERTSRGPVGNSQYGSVDALDGDDSIGAINEPNEGPYFGSRFFPSIGLPTADGARVLKII
jgi:hypothetical protein